jgi:hypothetical protein
MEPVKAYHLINIICYQGMAVFIARADRLRHLRRVAQVHERLVLQDELHVPERLIIKFKNQILSKLLPKI